MGELGLPNIVYNPGVFEIKMLNIILLQGRRVT